MHTLLLCLSTLFFMSLAVNPDIPMAGYDYRNTRNVDSDITPENVNTLSLAWTAPLAGAITTSPAIIGDKIYVLTWGGVFACLNKTTGAVVWQKNVPTAYGFPAGYNSRNTPTYYVDPVTGPGFVFGVQPTIVLFGPTGAGSYLVATDILGNLRWKSLVDDHPYAVITQSPIVENGVAYIGISSLEAQAPVFPDYPCCSGVGSFQALDTATGSHLWTTYTIPPSLVGPGNYSGGMIWNIQPALKGQYIYVGTGQLYSVPQTVIDCALEATPGTDCVPDGIWFDSMLKIDKVTGAIVWGKRSIPLDRWNIACILGAPLTGCTGIPGTDSDYSTGFVLYRGEDNGEDKWVVAGGQKNGYFWRRRTSDGTEIGKTLAGTLAAGGGLIGSSSLQWMRLATRGPLRPVIFVNDGNSQSANFTFQNGTVINTGHVSAIDGWTGQILWEKATKESRGSSMVASTNGVVFASTYTGIFTAIDGLSGTDLGWEFVSGHRTTSGPAISGGCIYWGTGSGSWFNGNDLGGGLTAHCLN